MRVLILGGTTEARALAAELALDERFSPIYSLAGRTAAPLLAGTRTRIGGFGGAEGLAAWLRHEAIDVVIDATHPYAVRISVNAVTAARECGLPLLRLHRPPWQRERDDDWREVANTEAACAALGTERRRVFLGIGRNELAVFKHAPQHRYVVRAVDAPNPVDLPPLADVILQRGPFTLVDELSLMRERAIEVVVSKNSGGAAAQAKIVAARQLGIQVVMIARPDLPDANECTDAEAALRWLDGLVDTAHGRTTSARGV